MFSHWDEEGNDGRVGVPGDGKVGEGTAGEGTAGGEGTPAVPKQQSAPRKKYGEFTR